VCFEDLKNGDGNEGGDFFQNRRLDLDSALAAGVGSPLTLLPFYLFSENYLILIFKTIILGLPLFKKNVF